MRAAAIALGLIAAPAAAADVEAISWKGAATIHAGDRTIEIGISTRVAPFASARSDSWLVSEGPAATRSLIIEPDRGWIERGGKREPMPDAMYRHEREQYALYGQMLAALGHKVAAAPAYAPATRFDRDASGNLTGAINEVDEAEGHGTVKQSFRFWGRIEDDGVAWPRQIDIAQDGKPYFTLRIDSFDAQVRPK